MMLQLHKQKLGASSIWDQIKILSDDKAKLQEVTNEIVEKTQIEEEFGNRKVDLKHSSLHATHAMHMSIEERLRAQELEEETAEEKRLKEIAAIRSADIAAAKKRAQASEVGSFQNMMSELQDKVNGKWEVKHT